MLLYAIQVIIMETEQFNIRLNRSLLKDLDVVSKLLKVNKSDWVKTKLAEDVQDEKNKLLMELSTLYVNGMVSKKEIESLVGKQIADQMESIRLIAKKSIRSGREYGKKLKERISS